MIPKDSSNILCKVAICFTCHARMRSLFCPITQANVCSLSHYGGDILFHSLRSEDPLLEWSWSKKRFHQCAIEVSMPCLTSHH